MEIFSEWNLKRCQPPWSQGELRHKLADAFRRTAPREQFTGPRQGAPPPRPHCSPSPSIKRPFLPRLRSGTAQDFLALASIRGLTADGLRLASERGLLRFGEYRGHGAWFILDGSRRVAQARRLDGEPWAQGVKAWTLFNSQAAWPVGLGEAREFASIALCEGGPDLLAAHCFITAEARARDCAAVAMLGGCARIHPDALPLLSGKRVRIFPHNDDTGQEAAERWAGQLIEAGAEVDAFALDGLTRIDGERVKDLNDLAQVNADELAAHPCLRSILP
jgi:hypothetical protein